MGVLPKAVFLFQSGDFAKVGETTKVKEIRVVLYPKDTTKPLRIQVKVFACVKPGRLSPHSICKGHKLMMKFRAEI